MEIGLEHYLTVAACLFTLGMLGIFLNRKNVIVILMSVELMLLATNLNLISFSHFRGDLTGQVFALFVLTVAAAEFGDRACHRRRLLQEPRLDRRRRRQHDEGVKVDNRQQAMGNGQWSAVGREFATSRPDRSLLPAADCLLPKSSA